MMIIFKIYGKENKNILSKEIILEIVNSTQVKMDEIEVTLRIFRNTTL